MIDAYHKALENVSPLDTDAQKNEFMDIYEEDGLDEALSYVVELGKLTPDMRTVIRYGACDYEAGENYSEENPELVNELFDHLGVSRAENMSLDPYDPDITPKQRASIAVRMILTGEWEEREREFDTCLEMNDSEQVWKEILKQTKTNPELAHILSQKIFKKIMLDIAKEVCDNTGATLGNDEYIDYDYSDSGDRLSASQIERILKSKDPADELYAIANTTGKFGVDCSFLDEAVTDALENIPQEQADFLEQYVHEHYPKGTSVEFAFREEHPVGIYYDLENSPLLNQEIPVDIIYEPDEKELAPSERYASAPLVLLAKQQGIEKEFRKEVAKRKETAKMDTPRGSQSPKDWTLAECLARENEVRDDGTSKFVFLANLTVKNCIDLLQLQKEERLLGKKAKGTISLPKTVIAGKYDFDGWNEMGFYLNNISILPKEVELPLKDIRLHNDEASRYRLADYFNSNAWTNEPVKICSTKELEKTATKASDPIR